VECEKRPEAASALAEGDRQIAERFAAPLSERNTRTSTKRQRIERAGGADILVVAVNILGVRGLKRCGSEHVGPCPLCGGRDRFAINRAKGLFNCRGCRKGGDAIDLAQHLLGCEFMEAVAFISRNEAVAEINREAQGRPPRGAKAHDHAASVRRILGALQPNLGTPCEAYLRGEDRKIDTDAISDILARTDAIGWNPSVYFHEAGHPLHGQRLGCIVAIMTDPVTAKPTGSISRTYIGPDGKKVGTAKNLDGARGIVRLSRDQDVLEGLHIGEGIETCLAAACGLRPVWSTGSAATMAKLPVLGGIEALTIIADNDENGVGLSAAREVEARWLDAGREVHIKLRDKLGDFNDAVREDGQ
jgi:hypothetical protein